MSHQRYGWLLVGLLALLAAGCSGTTDAPAVAIENYLQALVERDPEGIVSASCADWEARARTELESFGAVTVTLEELKCQSAGKDGSFEVIACSGKIIANYGNEVLEINLADRQYLAAKEAGDWRMCGYH